MPPLTPTELTRQARADALASLQRYCEENLPEPLGELPASLLLNFFLEEIGPLLYNQAIADAQQHLARRVADMNGELYRDEFPYWPRMGTKRKPRR